MRTDFEIEGATQSPVIMPCQLGSSLSRKVGTSSASGSKEERPLKESSRLYQQSTLCQLPRPADLASAMVMKLVTRESLTVAFANPQAMGSPARGRHKADLTGTSPPLSRGSTLRNSLRLALAAYRQHSICVIGARRGPSQCKSST